MRRDPVDDATLALLLEVAGTPKPGNVDRHRDLADLRFEAFLGGAVGAREGLELAADGGTGADGEAGADEAATVGRAFERGVEGMAARAGTNTQFGCLLLLVPLVRATVAGGGTDGDLTPAAVDRVARGTTVDDAIAFYRAFEHVDVAVADPPADAADLDVRRGGDAAPALRERDATLRDVMALSADPPESDGVPDRNAREWVEGFPRTFRAAEWIRSDEGPLTDRAARAFLGLLAAEPDTLIAANRGPETAREASERAAALLGGADPASDALAGVEGAEIDADAVHVADLDAAEELAVEFVDEGINPGTTADLTCAALYVALRRGAEVAP
ncbi:triphosphoribosyl-dephospho-CoA synthase [Halorubrum sp. CSM-61]|uniref:triphosphoribosyl-dephospho-CoA synthase n=1 Tax=Halorubrum sp. CSM-61 TaxID=2485838 RepID=UPI000F4AFC64|nr:triphosphoribosyl-dephospho-CoA synthase [Halorubrum sp. CSM-61]